MTDKPKPTLVARLKGTLSDLTLRAAEDRFSAHLDQLIHKGQERIREENEAIRVAHAAELVAQARLDELAPQVADLEEKILTALRGHRNARARELSQHLEPLLATVRSNESKLELARQQIDQRKLVVENSEGQIRRLRHQLALRRAAENLKRSQEAIHRLGEITCPTSNQCDTDASGPETAEQILQRLSAQAKNTGKSAPKKTKSTKSVPKKKATKKTSTQPRTSKSAKASS